MTVDETQGTMGMRKMRGEDVSPVFFMPPSFARKFSVRGRRLGTRQNQKHIYASVTKPLVSLCLLRALTLTPVTRMFYAYIRCTNALH